MDSHIDKQYFQPEISELFIGYELEYQTFVRKGEDSYDKVEKWEKLILTRDNFDSNRENWHNPFGLIIRTPYLCKQDIIDCGFSYNEERDEFIHPKTILGLGTGDDKKVCIYQYKTNVLIYTRENRGTEDTLFDGFCKSKNELKKLMKDYLNIPI